MKRRIAAIPCTILMATLGAAPLQAEADASPPPNRGYEIRQDGDWVRFEHRNQRRKADRVEKVHGTKDADGTCHGGLTGTVSKALNRATEGIEVGFNPSTCESLYEIRFLTEQELQTLRADEGVPTPEDPAAQPATPVGLASWQSMLSGTRSAAAFTESWYQDPPGWNVTWTRVTTNWSYNGSCVLSAGGTKNWTKMTQSGWGLVSEDWQNTVACANSRSALRAQFKNGVFCATIDTYNTYDRTEVRGEENGTASFYWPASKTGGCTSLLSHHYLTGFI